MKNTFTYPLIALILAVSIFVFFKTFDTSGFPDYAKELSAGFLGAVITVIITAVLLQAQSLSELRKEKSVGVFQAKLACYTQFIDFLNDIVDDGIMENDESNQFRQQSMRLSLVCGFNVASKLEDFFEQTLRFRKFSYYELTEGEQTDYAAWYADHSGEECEYDEDGDCYNFITIGTIINALKIDLGEDTTSKGDGAYYAGIAIDNMFSHRKKG